MAVALTQEEIDFTILEKEGSYGAIELHVGRFVQPQDLREKIADVQPRARGAVYLYFPLVPHANYSLALGSAFWKPFCQTPKYNVLYAWFGRGADRVQPSATSIAGGAAFVVSPDGQNCLLIQRKEGGDLLLPGGAVDEGELPVDAMIREVGEELNIVLTREKVLGLIGTYHKKNARLHGQFFDQDPAFSATDHWSAFVIVVPQNVAVEADKTEVGSWGWYNIKAIAAGKYPAKSDTKAFAKKFAELGGTAFWKGNVKAPDRRNPLEEKITYY